jgi:hypothetical protein
MEEMRNNFQKQRGPVVNIHYGRSGELFGMLASGHICTSGNFSASGRPFYSGPTPSLFFL